MNNKIVMIRKWVLTILLAMVIGSVLILMISENPLDAYAALIKGAFNGKAEIRHHTGKLYPAASDVHRICRGSQGRRVERGRGGRGIPGRHYRSLYRDQLDLPSGSDPAGDLFPGEPWQWGRPGGLSPVS